MAKKNVLKDLLLCHDNNKLLLVDRKPLMHFISLHVHLLGVGVMSANLCASS